MYRIPFFIFYKFGRLGHITRENYEYCTGIQGDNLDWPRHDLRLELARLRKGNKKGFYKK